MASSRSLRASLLLLAYNQESTVELAVKSCLAQECEPIEIVLSDDASTDATCSILNQLALVYQGPHRVTVRRNIRNLGIGEHINKLISCSCGDLLITAAGDDWSAPHRVRRILEAWDATEGQVDLISSHLIDLDEAGELHDVIRVDDLASYKTVANWAEHRPYVVGAGHAFTRRMMERFGPLAKNVYYEDEIMAFRAIAGGGGITIEEPLVCYRRGGTSRRPKDFSSPASKESWESRQRDREIAVIKQLFCDASLIGLQMLMHEVYGARWQKEEYLLRLRKAECTDERWQVLLDARHLPLGWRFRKLLKARYPRLSKSIGVIFGRFHDKRKSGIRQLARIFPRANAIGTQIGEHQSSRRRQK